MEVTGCSIGGAKAPEAGGEPFDKGSVAWIEIGSLVVYPGNRVLQARAVRTSAAKKSKMIRARFFTIMPESIPPGEKPSR
jgi:hypothetical protein